MDPERLNQIIETIKTFNLNVDSQTAVKIVAELKPVFLFWLIRGFIDKITLIIGLVVSIYFISRAIFQYWKKKEEK